MRVLIVEDDERIAGLIKLLLTHAGMICDLCGDGQSGLDDALTGIYDALVLDLMLPELDGLSVLHALRASGDSTPVLVLSARGSADDRIRSLDDGADYYLTKPFDNAELVACVRAVSRRSAPFAPEALAFGDLELNCSMLTLTRGPRETKLTNKECGILRLFMANPRVNLSKETLILRIWGADSEADGNNVEAYISILRKKLFELGSCVSIVSVRSLGYHLERPA